MIRTLLKRLTTDVEGLHNGYGTERLRLLAELQEATEIVRELRAENGRLRVLAGNTAATRHESLMLGLVRDAPGLLAREYGAAFAKIDPEFPTDYPSHWIIGNNAKHLTALHKKGLVRRAPAGQTYRYWVIG